MELRPKTRQLRHQPLRIAGPLHRSFRRNERVSPMSLPGASFPIAGVLIQQLPDYDNP